MAVFEANIASYVKVQQIHAVTYPKLGCPHPDAKLMHQYLTLSIG